MKRTILAVLIGVAAIAGTSFVAAQPADAVTCTRFGTRIVCGSPYVPIPTLPPVAA